MSSSGDIDGTKHGRNKCCFMGCARTKAKFPALHFFKFPVNRVETCEKWLFNCANEAIISLSSETLKYRVVCEKHFTPESFTSDMKSRLQTTAVPTLLSVEDDDEKQAEPLDKHPAFRRSLFTSPSSSKSQNHKDVVMTPIYKKLKSIKNRKPTPRKLKTPKHIRALTQKLKSALRAKKMYQQKLKRLSSRKPKLSKFDIISGVEEFLPPEVFKFFKMQINHSKLGQQLPFNTEERHQALLFRYKSPALYGEMRSKGFALPSRSTISRWLGEIELRPGMCMEFLEQIQTKVECMSAHEKLSVLLFDGMVIKKNLEYESKQDVVEGKFSFNILYELTRSKLMTPFRVVIVHAVYFKVCSIILMRCANDMHVHFLFFDKKKLLLQR